MGKLSENTWVRGSLVMAGLALAFAIGGFYTEARAYFAKTDKLEAAVVALTEIVQDLRRAKR